MTSQCKIAQIIAKAALGRIPRKFGRSDTVYDHSHRVALRTTDPKEATIAFLHDVVEDSEMTLEDLRLFFDEDIVQAVDLLTKRSDQTYSDYILNIRISENKIAMRVKLADLDDNSSGQDLPYSLRKRYNKAKEIILS